MTTHDMTPYHRSQLQAELARAREAVTAQTTHAVETGGKMPKGDPDDAEMKLYHLGGYYAMLFCFWFAFVSPIVLILMYWD